MTMIEFTKNSCKNENILNKQVIENFEEHFAMYSFTTIREIPNIEAFEDQNAYIVRADKEECNEIIDTLSRYRCSNFHETLIPVFTIIEEGLKIEFKIDGE